MTTIVHDALARHYDEFAVGRRLHAVPPHLVHEVTVGGRRAVCKVATGPPADPVTEARVTEWVAEHTDVPVPRVLAVGRDPDGYVAAWHDGAPAPDGSRLDEAKARAMGRGLAHLHAETAHRFGSSGHLRARDGGLAVDARARWSDTLVERVEARRAFLVSHDRATDADARAAGAVAEFVRAHRDHFDAAAAATDDDTAATDTTAATATDAGVALLHGTYLPDHVGTTGERVDCVLDFEHALVGPPAYDYLRTALPVFAGAEHAVPEAVFREAYESVRPLAPGFEHRRDAHVLVQTVSYLRALYVQDQHPDIEGRAAWFRDRIRETLAELHDRLD